MERNEYVTDEMRKQFQKLADMQTSVPMKFGMMKSRMEPAAS